MSVMTQGYSIWASTFSSFINYLVLPFVFTFKAPSDNFILPNIILIFSLGHCISHTGIEICSIFCPLFFTISCSWFSVSPSSYTDLQWPSSLLRVLFLPNLT